MDIDDIRDICLSLPGTEEEVKWETVLCFMVAHKIFCVVSLDTSPLRMSFKVKDEEFEELSQSDGFAPAPYFARAKYVQLTDISKLHRSELEDYLLQAYELVKAKLPKKVKQEWGLL